MGEWKKTNCNLCAQTCGLEVEVQDNKIINVRPDPINPRSRNYCCRKGRSIKDYHEHPDRLNYPLKRVDGKYVRITWDQAFQEISEKLKDILAKHGPRSLAMVGGAMAGAQGAAYIGRTFLGKAGSRYYYSPTGLEFMGVFWCYGKTLGNQGLSCRPDVAHSEVDVSWGSNAYVSHQMTRARMVVREASESPNKVLIAIDPRLSETARMADIHVALRPGTDALLARAMIALILKEGWQDQEYLDKRVADFDKICHWFEDFDIEAALKVCEVPLEQIREVCRLMTSRKCSVHQDLGVFMGRHNTMSSFLIIVLMCVCGDYMTVGGTFPADNFTLPAANTNEDDPSVWRTAATNWAPVLGTYPTAVLPQEIMDDNPDHLRAVFVCQSNPARSYPDSKAQENAFDHLDLLVCMDSCMTETARHAHYILPGMDAYEGYNFSRFQGMFPEVFCQIKHPIVKPEGERMEDAEIWLNLADAMGYIPPIPDSLYDSAHNKSRTEFYQDLTEFIKEHPEYRSSLMFIAGKTIGKELGSVYNSILWSIFMAATPRTRANAVRAGFKDGPTLMDDVFQAVLDHPEGVIIGIASMDPDQIFDKITYPDKKVHLYVEVLNDYINRITPEKEAEALTPSPEFPYILSAGTHADGGVNGAMRNPATYRYRNPCTMSIHPEDAAELGIQDGEVVRITTEAGSAEIEAEFTYRTRKGSVLIPHHYGFDFNGKRYGIPVNTLTSANHIEELTGNPIWRYVPCRIEKILPHSAAGEE